MSGYDERDAVDAAVVDDWESIGGDQVQQLTNERLSFAEQQQRTSVMEQQIMKEKVPVDGDAGLPPRLVACEIDFWVHFDRVLI